MANSELSSESRMQLEHESTELFFSGLTALGGAVVLTSLGVAEFLEKDVHLERLAATGGSLLLVAGVAKSIYHYRKCRQIAPDFPNNLPESPSAIE